MYINLKEENNLKEKLYLKYNKGFRKLFKSRLVKRVEKLSYLIKENNDKYIEKMSNENTFLNNVGGFALDLIQKEVVLSEEENTLVIAGAGSGKTLTILAKIIYLIKQGIKPEDILVLSFTNASANSLTNKLKKEGINLKALTFHKLGMQILRNNGYKFSVVKESVLDNIVSKILCLDSVRDIVNIKFITIGSDEADVSYLQEIIFKNSDYFFSLKQTIITFINLFKSRSYDLDMFNDFFKENDKEKNKYIRLRNKKYLTLIKDIYEKYESYLSINNKIDFNDMINKAVDVVNTNGIKNYKYIIIDEYQDTSLAKCHLLKAIKEKTGSRIMAVGDDWQSIYRFTGTDLTVFTKFEEYFPYTKVFKLQNTYRNSNELLKIVNKFIMQNKNQIPKSIVSNKYLENPIIIYYYDNNQKEVLNSILSKLDKPYFILGRNNNDIDLVDKNYQKNFMTVHKAKGLETDISVIINLEDSPLGFPNKIVNDDILKYVSNYDTFPYEEERRLFYVALTRTKGYNILLVNKNNPSVFAEEIIGYIK